MNSHGLTKENLLAALPQALQRDPSVSALAEGIAEVLAGRPAEIDRLRIYPAIDRLDERLLDILAQDFKVDWWDPNYSLEEKRRTLRDHWRVHKSLGTPAAVVTAISAIYQGTTLEEWFQYDGEPYHSRLNIDLTGDQGDPERMQRVLERLEYYKSLRSHLDSVDYSSRVGPLPFKTEEAVLFLTMMIPLRFPNVPDEIITLDGQRRLDGTWSLDQRVPGIRMPSLEITLTAAERDVPGLIEVAVTLPPARNEEHQTWPVFSVQTQGKNEQQADLAAVTLPIACRQTYRLSGTLMRGETWELDGTYQLDGTKRLNAASVKEEI